MTRDAEHTPSPQSVVVPVEPTEAMLSAAFDAFEIDHPKQYADGTAARKAIWSAMLAAAPSLAGGEVMNDDAPTYMRLAQALSRHPEVMVVERSDPTLELTPDSLEHLLEDVFPLAALSPEAPAREGLGWSVCEAEMHLSKLESLQPAVNIGRPDASAALEWARERLAALTPRHEAPAEALCSTCRKEANPAHYCDRDAGGPWCDGCWKVGDCKDLHGEGCHTMAWTAMDTDFSDGLDRAFLEEAPAEGAGETRDRLIEILKRVDDGVYASLNDQADAIISVFTLRPKDPSEGGETVASAARALLDACYKADENSDLSDFVDGMLLTRLDKALRARSSAPEAREGEAK